MALVLELKEIRLMRLRIVGALLILLIFGCSKSPKEKLRDSLQTAYGHMDRFEFDAAQKAFDEAAIHFGGYPYDSLGKGLIMEEKLYYYDALNQFLNLSKQFADSAAAYAGAYRVYSQFGYFDRALQAALKYHELLPKDPQAILYEVQGCLNARQFSEAIKAVESSTGNGLDKRVADFLRVRAYLGLNQFDSARSCLDRTLSSPLSGAVMYSLASDALEAEGFIDSAMSASRAGVHLPDAPGLEIYRHFYRALDNNYYHDARETIRLLEQKGAGKGIASRLQVMLAKDQKNFVKSRIIIADYTMSNPKNVSTILFDMACGGTQTADASLVLQQEQMAEIYMEDHKYNDELQTFVKLQTIIFRADTDDRVAAWKDLGAIQGGISQTMQVKLADAYVQYRTGQFESSLKTLKELRQSYKDSPTWLTNIADIYAHPAIKITDTALQTYDQALSVNKWYRDAFKNKVQFLRSLGRPGEALKQFDEYPHFENQYHDLALLKGICLAENKEFDGALQLFAKHGPFLKGNLEPFWDLSFVLENKYRSAELLKLAEMCAGWAGNNVDILMFAARLLADQNEFAKALELSEKALSLEPGYIEARVQKARALFGQGQRQPAFDLFEEALKEDPNDGDVNYYYSRILAKENIDPARAANMARSALRAFYSDEKAFLNLCQVYDILGDQKYAYGDAKKASMEIPNSAEVWYQFGLASFNLGRADAEENLKKAIALGLGGEHLKKAQKMLAKN